MTFGNPVQGDIAPYFVAVNFGDTRGVVYGTFDYLEGSRRCQFTSMDNTMRAQGIVNGTVHEIMNFDFIICPPFDARTVRFQLDLIRTYMPVWTVSANGQVFTTTFPSVQASTTSTSWRPSPTATWAAGSPSSSLSPLSTLLLTVFAISLLICLWVCTLAWSNGSRKSLKPSGSGPSEQFVAQNQIELATSSSSAAPSRSITNNRPCTNDMAGSSASPFSRHDALKFLAQNPSRPFPMDTPTLSAMQQSPAQWHFVNPTYALSPEYQSRLSPHLSFDPDRSTLTLFTDTHLATSRRRPHALSAQTRLPLPIPPADAQSSDSPYSGIRVPPTLYCELRILHTASADPSISIGLARGPYPPFQLPGCHKWSVAYNSRTGALHMGTAAGSVNEAQYGPKFGKGDIVGIGVNTVARCVFFTLNGEQLPLAVELPLGTEAVYPTVGATGQCTVEYNFGTSGFRWAGGAGAGAGGDECEFVGYVMDVLPVYAG